MSKDAGIDFLKHQLAAVEAERKKLEAAVAKLPQLEAEAQAIKLLLSKYGGKDIDQTTVAPQAALYSPPGPSVCALALRALSEAGKPQTTTQILASLASHGKVTTSATLRSTILINAHKNKLFKVYAPGVYGLKEWPS